jgi:hypothetical protein
MKDTGGHYAVFWINENGYPGNGEYILDEATLRAWLGELRFKYPKMEHWGQLPNGERYAETVPVHHDVSFWSRRSSIFSSSDAPHATRTP